MWSYYGSKSKIVKKYPRPLLDTIVEPFAGSARYSLLYWEKDVILIDKYNVIIQLWKYLQQCSIADILNLPKMRPGETTDDFNFDCIEQKWLMGFMVQQGVNAPRKTVSKVFANGKMGELIERDKRRIASNLHKIRHWRFVHGEYDCLDNLDATWFIDPPYQHGGQWYKASVSNKHIDFLKLAEWSKSRNGQVMVCENSKADWMDFKFLSDLSGSKHKTKEVLWYKNA